MKRFFLLSVLTGLMVTLTYALNHTGTINANEAWFTSDNPHVITGNLTVADGVTLLIQPGCEVYFNGNFRIIVEGVLSANGTSGSHILFTSNQAVPSSGDWRFINFDASDLGSMMNYCDVKYGGSVAARGMINFSNGPVGLTITNCNLSNSGSYGFEYRDNLSTPQITDCYITSCNNYPIYTFADKVKNITGNMNISGNVYDVIFVRTQPITTGTWQNFGVPYIIGGNLTVNNGQTWTINSGNVLKFNGNRTVTIAGTLIANGTSTEHIVFTSNQIIPASGDWNRIYFNVADAGCILNYCDILYAGSGTSAVDINGSLNFVTISNTTIEYSAGYGLFIRNNSSPSIKYSSIRNNEDVGIYVNGACTPTFGTSVSEWNEIYGNGNYGLRCGSQNITAKYIYWGTEACGDLSALIFDKSDQNNLGIVDYLPWLDIGLGLPSFATTWTGASNTLWDVDGNWDNYSPCTMIDVTIPKAPANQPIVLSSEYCNDLTLEAGAQLTVFSGSSLAVAGNFFMEANSDGTASLLETGGFTVAGSKTIQLFVEADRWHYITSPLSGQTANTFYDMYLYDWSEAAYAWNNIVEETTPLNVGQGYKLWSSSTAPLPDPPGTTSVEFTGGNINTGNYFLPVTKAGTGWNLVGNPYPCAVDWDYAGWIKSNISGTIYTWDGTQYITWNGTVGDLTGGVIPGMQGFYVVATGASPQLVVSNSAKLHGIDPYKESEVNQLLEISLTGNGYADKTFVNFNELSSAGFDNDFDGYKIYGLEEAPQLYTRQDENILRVNVLPKVYNGLYIPMGLEVPAEAEYTIVVNGISSFTNVSVYLEDTKEGIMIDLSNQIDYTFNASPIDAADRFILHFGVMGIEDQPQVATNEVENVIIYSNDHNIYIKSNNQQNLAGNVIVYNIMGQEVLNKRLENSIMNKMELFTETGYYVVKVFGDSGVYTKKIFIE
jgi:hypothetical protein